MNAVVELFGLPTNNTAVQWGEIVENQQCPFRGAKCDKARKSEPDIIIGTCTVRHSKRSVIICPRRLLAGSKIFTDSLHLLMTHEPGNQLHVIPEVRIPGGIVDYFIVSERQGKVRDFAGVELQTLDTTGTVWPERQRLLHSLGVAPERPVADRRRFGMNWKMTAKTILMQLHHKLATFEHVNKRLVLVMQDWLLLYMEREFSFNHLRRPALDGDPMQIHAYTLDAQHQLHLASRLSTDTEGIAKSLGLQAESRLELSAIVDMLQAKISAATVFTPVTVAGG